MTQRSLTLSVLFFLLFETVVLAQKVRVQQIKGECQVSPDMTLSQARENAINQAKAEALREAGVPEIISASNVLYRSGRSDSLKQLFETLTTVDVSGELSEFAVTKEEKKMNDKGDILYRVWIDATVAIHKSPKDPAFGLDVKGVRESYSSPDKLVFEVQPWKDGYLMIFILSGNEGVVLFPNKVERQVKLLGKQKYEFPISRGLNYEVSTERESEINYLLLLYTKEEMQLTKEETPQNILTFISSIEPPAKCLKTYSFLIRK